MKARFHRFLLWTALAVVLTAAFNVSAFYDPTVGRWASRDPIGEQGGLNSYAFTENNPNGNVDFLGMKITEYTVGSADIRYMPPTPNNNGGVSLGETKGIWDGRISVEALDSSGRWPVKVIGNLRVEMLASLSSFLDEQGRLPVVHEIEHEKIHAKWWNQMKSEVDGIEGSYCRKECADIVAKVGTYIVWMDYWQARGENVGFDLAAYPTALKQLNLYAYKLQEFAVAKQSFDLNKAEYERWAREWDRRKCQKSD